MTTTSIEQEVSRPAVDYIEGWYAGDATRMASAVHPEMAKRYVRTIAPGFTHLEECGGSKLVAWTASGQGARIPSEHQFRAVTVLDHVGWQRGPDIATVKVRGATGVEYLQEAQFGPEWLIVNILASPRTASPFKVRPFEAAEGQNVQDRANEPGTETAIRDAALDYLVGCTTAADPRRVARAIHPQLLKRSVRQGEDGQEFLEAYNSSKLLEWARSSHPSEPWRVDVHILDRTPEIAAVRMDWLFDDEGNYQAVDCVCLGCIDGEWKVINILFAGTRVADGDWKTWEW